MTYTYYIDIVKQYTYIYICMCVCVCVCVCMHTHTHTHTRTPEFSTRRLAPAQRAIIIVPIARRHLQEILKTQSPSTFTTQSHA